MKDGVVLVNTARGAVIDEAALVKALDSGRVASVGLDVYEEEPKIHPGLESNPNVMLLPHMGKQYEAHREVRTVADLSSSRNMECRGKSLQPSSYLQRYRELCCQQRNTEEPSSCTCARRGVPRCSRSACRGNSMWIFEINLHQTPNERREAGELESSHEGQRRTVGNKAN